MSTVIKVENLSKQYRLGEVGTGSMKDDIKRFRYKLMGKEDPFLKVGQENDRTKTSSSDYVWALKDINFEIKQGDVVGIIGKNGSGKSTLLKILSRTTTPTIGSIKMKGRMASLLEVGTGFHGELSGRDNIFLNGAIMGLKKQAIKNKLDEIIDFAGIEKYLDTPVKRYSSGMYVRLAFAVAAYLEPDILIVDEVLAVGDIEFQKKCLGKIKEVSQNEGRTVLFVSHNMDTVVRLCTQCIFMQNGRIIEYADTEKVVSTYLNAELNVSSFIKYDIQDAPGSEKIILLESKVINQQFDNKVNYAINEPVGIKVTFSILEKSSDLVLSFNLYNQYDIHLLSSHHNIRDFNYDIGIYETVVWIPANFLTEGLHYCGVAAVSYNPFRIHLNDIKKISFHINDMQGEGTSRGNYNGQFPGLIRPLLAWDNISKI